LPLIIESKTSFTHRGWKTRIDRIKEIITCDFEIKHHFAGVRPTVKDRRPLVGIEDNITITSMAGDLSNVEPAMAKALYEWIKKTT
jgi:hypothetical protein